MWTSMLTLGHSRQFGAGCTHRLRLSWEPGGGARIQVNASVTSVIHCASRRAPNTSSCLGSDLSLWNVHNRGQFGGDFGGPTGAQPCVSTLYDISRHNSRAVWSTASASGAAPPLAPWCWPHCGARLDQPPADAPQVVCVLLVRCTRQHSCLK